MSLERYREKRDFGKSPEPRGKPAQSGRQLAYFVQRHDASRLHYDFRLELEGVLKSWAIPKGPSLDPADKRLAVQVEDHPLDYGPFEGEIPPDQYGGGTVLLWDRGIWIPEGDPVEGYQQGRLKFRLDGQKLSGGWSLVRMKSFDHDQDDKKQHWLLIKERDDAARSGDEADIIARQPESVAARHDSGRPRHTRAGKPVRTDSDSGEAPLDRIRAAGAKEARMPEQIRPQLAMLSERAPEGDDWLSEVKFDGYRALCRIEQSQARLYTRAGHDWTAKWPAIAQAAARLPVEQAWLDGEIVAFADDGSISFQALQDWIRNGASARLAYYVFDLIYLNGHDLSGVPLLARKNALKALLAELDPGTPVLYSGHIAGDAQNAYEAACMHGLEGIMAKRADARYVQSRGRSWLKLKCRHRQEFVIGGYSDPAGSRAEFGALLLGVHDENGKLRYAGRVGTGFDAATLKSVAKHFSRLWQAPSPFANPPTGHEAHGVHWLKPELVAEIEFAEWTTDGLVRQASFIGLRTDKPAREIVREQPLPADDPADPPGSGPSAARPVSNEAARVAGIALSHASRILFPGTEWTKLDLARYYEKFADRILPHLRDRPLVLVRCPQGGGESCFFQKHADDTISPAIGRIEVPEGDGSATYMLANDLPAIVSLVQIGVLEFHTWGASQGHLDKPDRMIFDLDPAPELPWRLVVEAAQLMRALLDDVGLASFVKTTGGKGLHVAVPLVPERSWKEIKRFSKAIAEHMEKTIPSRFTAIQTKSRRTGKLYIDYLRNAEGATAVAAYSTRARAGAPISTPIAWDELDMDMRADRFNLGNIGQRLGRLDDDPWSEYFHLKQRITAKMAHIFGLS
ncbi:MAG: DNA ligase D [Sulfuricella sp.]|nr:DNA ligase D [Sulfuricella sp.]